MSRSIVSSARHFSSRDRELKRKEAKLQCSFKGRGSDSRERFWPWRRKRRKTLTVKRGRLESV
jgi:hypothetical protein